LQCLPHGLAADGDETLEAQDVVRANCIGHLGGEGCGIGNFAACDDEAFEFVMAMFMGVITVMIIVAMVIVIRVVMMVVVHFVARVEIGLGPDALAQQHINRQRAHCGFDNLHAVAALGLELACERVCFMVAEQIGFVDHDHIGAGDLIFKQL